MNSCACLVVLICNNRLLQYGGDMAIGAYGIVNRVVFLFVTFIFGLVQGMQPIVGYNWGARQDDRVFLVLRYGIIWATSIAFAAFLTGELIPTPVIHIFGAGPELTEKAVRAFHLVVAAFPLVGAQMVIGNFFQSIGHAGKSIFLSVTRQMLFLIPLLAVLPEWWGLDGVWLSMPISDSISFVAAACMLAYMIRKIKRNESRRTA
jgi:Na+-driven multidrug efflux pump